MYSLEYLQNQFNKGFYYPKPLSKKFRKLRIDELFLPEENIAGPLYSMAHKGNCDYIFNNKIKSAKEFYHKFLMKNSKMYHKELKKIKPANRLEERDLLIFTRAYRVRKKLCLLAYKIQKDREC